MTEAIRIEGLSKRFGTTDALRNVSLSVRAGEVFGFIGPDGAGKTTLFRILSTLLVADAGRADVLGLDVATSMWSLRPRLGYMPGRFSLYPDLSVEENLAFFATVFGTSIERERKQIAPIYQQLEPFKSRRAGALSGGMKQKLALCCALVHRPDILFLDEPTTGVDAVSRREFWELLASFKASGPTILISTPYMDEATRCDRIALMQEGRLLTVDTPAGITAGFDRPLFAIRSEQRYAGLLALREFPHTQSVFPFGESLHYADRRTDLAPAAITGDVCGFLEARGIEAVTATQVAPGIEDCFMALVGRSERNLAA